MQKGLRDFKEYINERVHCYPFMAEMINLYKGLIEIWDAAAPDDLSLLFDIKNEKITPDKTISNGFPLFNKNRIVDVDFTNSLDTAGKIINLTEKEKKETALANKDLSVKEIEDFIREGLYRDEKYKNIVLRWILKPSFSHTLRRMKIDASSWESGRCPLCYSPPGMAIVDKVEKDASAGASERASDCVNVKQRMIQQRYLSCCFCGFRWPYLLTGCPSCGNNKPERLGFFSDGSDCEQGTRGVSCEECKTYLKTVFINCRTDKRGIKDLDMDIEDAATIPLDMIACQRGYIAICQK